MENKFVEIAWGAASALFEAFTCCPPPTPWPASCAAEQVIKATPGQLTRIWWPKQKPLSDQKPGKPNQSKSFQDLPSDLHLNESLSVRGRARGGGGRVSRGGVAASKFSAFHIVFSFCLLASQLQLQQFSHISEQQWGLILRFYCILSGARNMKYSKKSGILWANKLLINW